MNRQSLAFLAILFLTTATWAQTQELGRLFFTPEKRAALDRQRQLNLSQNRETLSENTPLTLNGIVRRSSGRGTNWVNGSAMEDSTGKRSDAISVKTPGGNPQLRVGDTLNQTSGEREDLLKGGSISVRRTGQP